jgi:uncharacterized protein YjbI with pentapeptide repeats
MAADDFDDEGSRGGVAATQPVSPIAAKAEDLEAFRKSVEDTAAVSGGLWLSYLFVLFYLGVAAGAVTHTDLLLQNPVKLPFLNIELPLLAFSFLAPLLFVITHAYTLVNLALLADRVQQFHKELGDQFAADPALQPRASQIRSALTRQLPGNIFVQFLGGPEEIRRGALGKALAVILWFTLVVAPIALLLLLQMQFLPYHSRWVTWINRAFLALDLGLIWWLWGKILHNSIDHSNAFGWRSWAKTFVAVLLSMCLILFACAIATIRGEWQEGHLPYQAGSNSLRRWIFPGFADIQTRRPTSLFSRTLVMPGFNIYEALKIDDPKKVEWRQHLIDLRGRDLKGAVLDDALLPRADLRFAQLEGAFLHGAQLQGARLETAQLQGASLYQANLDGAWLLLAQLQGAVLTNAQLQGAVLYNVQLQGAMLEHAQLQGASLGAAQLQGTSLFGANLQGAGLDYAQLQGASLDYAQLQGANLADALLWRAQLEKSVLENIFDAGGKINWSPIERSFPAKLNDHGRPWTDATYAELRKSIERDVPQGKLRNLALDRVAILDCERRDNDTLASCDPSDALPDAVKQWKKTIEAASIDPNAYAKALTAILGDLVCSDKGDRIYVLRGLLHTDHGLDDIGPERPALMKRITSTECPLSTALTDADKETIASISGRMPR